MKFNITVYHVGQTYPTTFDNLVFSGCSTVAEVRGWLNGSHRFIDIGDRLINLDNVVQIIINKSE